MSLGCRTTSASKPTTVSRPLESADTAYMVVSLERRNDTRCQGRDRCTPNGGPSPLAPRTSTHSVRPISQRNFPHALERKRLPSPDGRGPALGPFHEHGLPTTCATGVRFVTPFLRVCRPDRRVGMGDAQPYAAGDQSHVWQTNSACPRPQPLHPIRVLATHQTSPGPPKDRCLFRAEPLPLLFPESGPPPPLVQSGKLFQDQPMSSLLSFLSRLQTRSPACPHAPTSSLSSWLSFPLPVVQPSAGSGSTLGTGPALCPQGPASNLRGPPGSPVCSLLEVLPPVSFLHQIPHPTLPRPGSFSTPTSPASPGGGFQWDSDRE